MRIRAVLFDATGTLIEVREAVGERYARMAATHGVDLPAARLEQAFREVIGDHEVRLFPNAKPREVRDRERSWWRQVVHATFRAADPTVDFEDFDRFFDVLFDGYATSEAWRLRAGAKPCLEALVAAGLRLGVVSDFDYRLTKILESLGIADFFDTITLAGEHGLAKPDPRLFEAALRSLGHSAAEAVFVGDDPIRDLQGAREVGITAVDVTRLSTLAELPAHLATLGDCGTSPE